MNFTREVVAVAHDVYISYSSHDKPIADAICAALEAAKTRCWIAPRDVLPGVPYGEALGEALRDSQILLLVFSSNSNCSAQVMREVESAVDKGIPILPFRIENVQPSPSLDYFVKAIHWLDAITPPLEKHLESLAETIRSLLTRRQTGHHAEGRPGVDTDTPSPSAARLSTPATAKPATRGTFTVRYLAAAGAVAAVAAALVLLAGWWPRAGAPSQEQQSHSLAKEPKIGESVFAFFQKGEVYFAATVVEEDADSKRVYRVVFEDGDIALVPAAQMRPLEVKEGLKIFARWKDGKYYGGTVAKVVGRAVYIHYDDGTGAWASLGNIAVKAAALVVLAGSWPRAGAPSQEQQSHSLAKEPKVGESVFAFFPTDQKGEVYFAATVVEEDAESKGVYRVVFEDGGIALVAAAQMRRLEVKEGLKVLARWKDGKYYGGTVAKVVGRAVYIHYDDGTGAWASWGNIAVK